MPAVTSVSSHRRNTPPRVPAHVTRSYSAPPEFSLPPPRPILVPSGDIPGRLSAHDEYSETVGRTKDDEEEEKSRVRCSMTTYLSSWPAADPAAAAAASSGQFTDPKMVGARLHPTLVEAKKACKKAETKGEKERDVYYNSNVNRPFVCAHRKVKHTVRFLSIAIGLQVLLGALTTAVGAALSGKNVCIQATSFFFRLHRIQLLKITDIDCDLRTRRCGDGRGIISGTHA